MSWREEGRKEVKRKEGREVIKGHRQAGVGAPGLAWRL